MNKWRENKRIHHNSPSTTTCISELTCLYNHRCYSCHCVKYRKAVESLRKTRVNVLVSYPSVVDSRLEKAGFKGLVNVLSVSIEWFVIFCEEISARISSRFQLTDILISLRVFFLVYVSDPKLILCCRDVELYCWTRIGTQRWISSLSMSQHLVFFLMSFPLYRLISITQVFPSISCQIFHFSGSLPN